MDRLRSDPYTDWFLMLVIAFGLAVAFVSFGLRTYFATQDRLSEQTVAAETNNSKLFSAEALSRVLETFDARATERASLMQGGGVVGDPSL